MIGNVIGIAGLCVGQVDVINNSDVRDIVLYSKIYDTDNVITVGIGYVSIDMYNGDVINIGRKEVFNMTQYVTSCKNQQSV